MRISRASWGCGFHSCVLASALPLTCAPQSLQLYQVTYPIPCVASVSPDAFIPGWELSILGKRSPFPPFLPLLSSSPSLFQPAPSPTNRHLLPGGRWRVVGEPHPHPPPPHLDFFCRRSWCSSRGRRHFCMGDGGIAGIHGLRDSLF